MPASLNVQELIEEVRSQLDEFNTESISDAHILQALNRAQKAATRVVTRKQDDIFLETTVLRTDDAVKVADGTFELTMPGDVFGRMIEKLEIRQGGSAVIWRILQISYKQRDPFVLSSQVARPYYYDIKGTKLRLYPNVSAGQEIIIHYAKTPDRLVAPQGQINRIDLTNNYVIVDNLGSGIITESDQRNSYVNIVDYITGEVKATLQVAFYDPAINQIKFKSTGLNRTTVFGKPVVTAIPASAVADDYLCLVQGTCVAQLPDAYIDYFVQYALVEIKRRLREPTQEDYAALKDIEEDLKKIAAGREPTQRVRKAAPAWNSRMGNSSTRIFS